MSSEPTMTPGIGISILGKSWTAWAASFGRYAWVPIPLLFAALLLLRIAAIGGSYQSPGLLFLCSVLFGTLTAAAVAFLAARSFLASGSLGLLLLGCGILTWGLGNAASTALPDAGINKMLTIHNICCWVAALFHIAGVTVASSRQGPVSSAGWWLLVGYLSAVVMVGSVAALSLAGLTPTFFVQGFGGTYIRYIVLFSASAMFGVSGSILLWDSRSTPAAFPRWYGCSLLLVAVSLFGLMLQTEWGSVLGWTARCTQWLGGVYFLVAAGLAASSTEAWRISVASAPEEPGLRYGMAVAFVVAALVIRLLFLPGLGSGATYVTFFPAVILASLYGGRGPGLLASVLGALLVNVFWIGPLGHLALGSSEDLGDAGLFLIGSAAVAFMTGAMQLARSRAASAEAKLLLNGELETATNALRLSEKSARDSLCRAEAASRARDDFVAALSHELRTPLTPVLMSSALIRDDPRLPADLREGISLIHEQVCLEARLIDDLLDLTRVLRGKVSLMRDIVDLHDVIRKALAIVSSDATDRSIDFALRLEAEVSTVNGDSIRLQQVAWNLIRNAIRFSPEGSEIRVVTRNVGDRNNPGIRLEVADHGIGLHYDQLDVIFLPFEQVGSAERHSFGGLGLGLAISKGIVDAHSGEIFAESRGLGLGSTFVVELATSPRPQNLMSQDLGNPAGSVTRSAGLNILLVEDHQPTRKVLTTLLRRSGHNVHAGASVEEGLQLFKKNCIDLLVADIGLPDGTGNELLERIRESSSIPAIAVSGYGMEGDIAAARKAGFHAHLLKPLDFDHLRLTIDRLAAPKPAGDGSGSR